MNEVLEQDKDYDLDDTENVASEGRDFELKDVSKKLKKDEMNQLLLKELHKTNMAEESFQTEVLNVLKQSNELTVQLNESLQRSNDIQKEQLSFFKTVFSSK